MLTRWAILSPARIRTLSPSSPRAHDGGGCFRFQQTLLPSTQAFPHSQRRRQQEASDAEWEPKEKSRVQKSLSWSVNRNQLRNLKQLKVALTEADHGSIPEVRVIEELRRRIPDLPAALKLNEERGSGVGGVEGSVGASTSSSFTHDAGFDHERRMGGQRVLATESQR